MEEYLRHLKAIVGSAMGGIYDQDLQILREKYGLNDDEYESMLKYCAEHSVEIIKASSGELIDHYSYDDPEYGSDVDLYDSTLDDVEVNESKELAKCIAERIMQIAICRALMRTGGKGWICGKYTDSVLKSVERKVRRAFSKTQMRYIIDHIPEKSDDDIVFIINDPSDPDEVLRLCTILNMFIPKITVRTYPTELFKDHMGHLNGDEE